MTRPSLPKRILVGISCEVDTTGVGIARADRHAFMQAAWLAQRYGGQVRAFHVTDFLDDQLAHGRERVAQVIRNSIGGQLEAMCEKTALSQVPATFGFGEGKPWLELLREAHRWEADLVVITPRRDDIGVTSRILHGSTARRIIRQAPAPVWVSHPGPSVEVNNVLACVDGSPASSRVMAAAQDVAELNGAKRTVLRCLDYPDDIALRRLAHAEDALRSYHTEVRGQAEAHLAKLVEETGGDWTVALDDGYVADVVPERVSGLDIDLVVLSSTSRTKIAGFVFGTTAERILAHAAVSTLVIRPDGWAPSISF